MGLSKLGRLESQWVQYTSRARELRKKSDKMEKEIDEMWRKAMDVLDTIAIIKPDHPVVRYYKEKYRGLYGGLKT